jgi:hypothetical protein
VAQITPASVAAVAFGALMTATTGVSERAVDSTSFSPATQASDAARDRWFGLSEAAFVAALSAVGYAVAYAREIGYIDRYNIPFWLVSIQLTQVLVSGLLISSVALWLAQYARLLPNRLWLALPAQLVVPVGCGLAVYVVTELTEWVRGLHLFIPIALITLFASWGIATLWARVIGPIARLNSPMDGTQSWWEVWEATWREQREKRTSRDNIYDAFLKKDPTRTRIGLSRLAVLCAVIIFATYWIGYWESVNEQWFAISMSSPPCAVLRQYESILCVTVDTARREALDEFRLIPANDASKEVFRIRQIGPLRTAREVADDGANVAAGPRFRKVFLPRRPGSVSKDSTGRKGTE